MKHKLFILLLAIVASAGTLWASDTEVDGIWYAFDSNKEEASVTYRGSSYRSYPNRYSGAVTIPPSVTYNNITYSVTSIEEMAFYNCTGLTSITIPNSVTSIGREAFFGCTGLTSITIPNSVTSIGNYAFYYCTGLTKVTLNSNAIVSNAYSYNSNIGTIFGSQVKEYIIGDSVTSIGTYAFYACFGLTSITIPNSVTGIGEQAFYGCKGLTSITIPNSVTGIGQSAFYGCTGLTSVTIGNSVTSIEEMAFYKCTGLTSITIGNSVTGIGGSAFYYCTGLTKVTLNSNAIVSNAYSYNSNIGTIFGSQVKEYIIGDSVTSIGTYAFSGCTGLTSITIPNSVTGIGQSAFYGCTGLTSVTIGDSVTSIEEMAFYKCTGLTSITIPNSVTSIGRSAFSGCTGLTSPVYNAHCFAYMPTSYSGAYTIPDGIKQIAGSAFNGCTGLTSITIPNSVTEIGSSAFWYCTGLTSITIPNSVTEIGREAFSNCTNLTAIVVNSGNTKYDSRNNCNAIIETATNTLIAGCKNTVIPNSVTGIGYGAFVDCTGLTSITLPNSVTSIEEMAFYNCTGLTSITIPNSVTSIGREAFFGCTGLTSPVYNAHCFAYMPTSYSGAYTIPDGIKQIEGSAFYGRTGLTSITIPNSVTSIGDGAFSYCPNLTSITIGNSVTSIGYKAFYNCSSLTAIYVPCGEMERFQTMLKDYADKLQYPPVSYTINKKAEHGTIATTSTDFASLCDEHPVTCTAVPDPCFRFVKWSDGNTDNPRTIEMTQDTTIEAFFDYSLEGKCGKDNALTWKFNPSSMALDITGKGALSENYTYGTCIESVTIGNEVTVIGQNAFKNCTNLTSVTIPKSVKTIGEDAFDGCDKISEIRFDGTLNYWCAKSWTPIEISSEYDLYIADKKITALVVPNGVTMMKEYAFAGCKSLTSVLFPESVTSIESYAFKNCTSLAYAIIPSSVNTIKSDAFSGCSSLKSVTCYRTTPPELSQDAFANIPSECVLYVLEQSLFVYMNDATWDSSFREILPIGAVQDYNATDDVTVTPSENTADVVWPQTADAATYELVIKDKNGNVICTLVFNADGQLTQIEFAAPSRINAPEQAQASGFAFTVTGLNSGTVYDLTLTAKNSSGATLNSWTVSFSTQGPTALEDIADTAASASGTQKVMIDGQLYLLRDGKVYNATGAEVK